MPSTSTWSSCATTPSWSRSGSRASWPGLRAVRVPRGSVPPDRVRRAGAQGGVARLARGPAVHLIPGRRRPLLAARDQARSGPASESARRRASVRRSASSRSSSTAEWSTKRIASASARWPGLLGDQAVHRLADAPVGGVALGGRPELQHVHRLAGVHLHVEADAVRHAHGVGRHRGELRRRDRVVERGRRLHDPPPVGAAPGLLDGLGDERSRAGGRAAATRATAAGGAGGRGTRRSR